MTLFCSMLLKEVYYLKNTFKMFKKESYFKVAFIFVFAVIFETGLFILFYRGLQFISFLGGSRLLIIQHLFSLFFLAIGIMLFISALITSYSVFFRSPDIDFLFVLPVGYGGITLYKMYEVLKFSSWAYMFIMIPFAMAYLLHERLSPLFILICSLFSIPFLVFVCAVACLLTIVFVRYVDISLFKKVWVWLALAVILLVSIKSYVIQFREEEIFGSFSIAKFIPGMSTASNPFLPSRWLSTSILAMVTGDYRWRGMMYLLVLFSNTLLAVFILFILGNRIYPEALLRWRARAVTLKKVRKGRVFIDLLTAILPEDLGSVISKDIRLFLRDPEQWGQVIMFFGLLGLYFMNLKNFRYHWLPSVWKNLISFLNVFSVSAVVCSLGARYIYPQMSLEAQNMWIISTVSLTRILLAKFLFSSTGMIIIAGLLITCSCKMLEIDPFITRSAVIIVCAISVTVSGLSVGLGACWIEKDRKTLSAIVSSFGGTLNLVSGLVFMLTCILPVGFVFHLYRMGRIEENIVIRFVFLYTLLVMALAVLICIMAIFAGARRLKRMEF